MNDLVLPKIDANGQRNTAWRINNGDGTFGSEHEFVKPSFVAVDQLDIDGDGDLDLYGRENRNYVWYENTLDETGGFQETTNLISTDSISDSGDFNNDGLIDFIVSDTSSETVRQIVSDPNDPLNVTFLSTRTYTNKIILLRNTGSEFVTETIFEGESDENVQRTEVLDLDADGKLDVLLVSNNSSLLLRNSTDASEANRPVVTASFDEPELQDWQPGISPDSSLGISTNSWHSADVDEDGDIDFAYATFRNVLWAENDGGNLKEAAVLPTPDDLFLHTFAFNADMDGDGTEQIVFQNGSQLVWFEDISVFDSVRFSESLLAPRLGHGDLDGDADVDFVEIVGNNIRWYDSIAEGNATPNVIQQTEIERGDGLVAMDIDGDGDLDPALETRGDLVWYENLGQGDFGPIRQAVKVTPSNWILDDFDSDGSPDVITWQDSNDIRTILVHRNQGDGKFDEPIAMTETRSTTFIDIDGDGDLDLLSNPGIEPVVKVNNNGTFSSGVSVPFKEWKLEAADIDGDGDTDVFGFQSQNVAWYENISDGGYVRHVLLEPVEAADPVEYQDFTLADIDNDGDMDLLLENEDLNSGISPFATSKILEFKDGDFAETNEIRTTRFGSIEAVDLNNDGLDDYVGINSDEIEWYENLGDLQFQSARPMPINDRDLLFADLDGDQRPDLLTIFRDEELQWQQNQFEEELPAPPSSPLVDRIFATIRSGEYNEDDDWNGDGVVSHPDVVFYLEEVAGTPYGDVNLDGQVNFADFLTVSSNYSRTDASYIDGDLDGDGTVGFGDFLLLFSVLRSAV